VTVDGPGLALYPDRQVRADPRERAIARRSYQAVHDLPVIVRHGHADPWLLLDVDTVIDVVAGCPREVFKP
jgi:glucuronate isomerase